MKRLLICCVVFALTSPVIAGETNLYKVLAKEPELLKEVVRWQKAAVGRYILANESRKFTIAIGSLTEAEFKRLKSLQSKFQDFDDSGRKVAFRDWMALSRLMNKYGARIPWGAMTKVDINENTPLWEQIAPAYKADCKYAEIEDDDERAIFVCEYSLEILGDRYGHVIVK